MIRKRYGKVVGESDKRRQRRRLSIRSKIAGTSDRPRVCAARSNKHLNVQVIDDQTGHTLLAVQTFGKSAVKAGNNVEGAKVVGAKLAEELKGKNINAVVFDRAGYKYTGVVKALVESVRENGIQV